MPTIQSIQSGKVQTILRSVTEQACREDRHHYVPTLVLNRAGEWVDSGDRICAHCSRASVQVGRYHRALMKRPGHGRVFLMSPDPHTWADRWVSTLGDAKAIAIEREKDVRGFVV